MSGKHGFDGFRKALQAVNAGDEDVFYAPVLQFGHYLEPELCPFGFGGPHAEDFLNTVKGDTDGQIDGLVDDPAIMPHLDPDGIKVHDGIYLVQGPVLPEG